MDDYISRGTLRDELASLSVTVTGLRAGKGVLYEYMKQYRESVLRVVDEQASADVAPVRRGRWEPYFEDVEIYNTGGFTEKRQTGWICGKCRSKKSFTQYYKTRYCPNCGARMDGDD